MPEKLYYYYLPILVMWIVGLWLSAWGGWATIDRWRNLRRAAVADRNSRIHPREGTITLRIPANVIRFEVISYSALMLGFVTAVLGYPNVTKDWPSDWWEVDLVVPVFYAVFGMLVVLMIWLVARRRKNWARWLFLVLTIIGATLSIPVFSEELIANPLIGITNLSASILQMIALYFVFTGEANAWFHHE